MMTSLRRHPEQYLQKSRFTRYFQYFRDVRPSYTVTSLGFRRAFGENPKLVGGKLFGDDHDTVSQTCRTISPHPLQKQPSYAGVWALGLLASPHVQLASVFLMFIRCCASSFKSVQPFLAAPAFCTVFTAFSDYPTRTYPFYSVFYSTFVMSQSNGNDDDDDADGFRHQVVGRPVTWLVVVVVVGRRSRSRSRSRCRCSSSNNNNSSSSSSGSRSSSGSSSGCGSTGSSDGRGSRVVVVVVEFLVLVAVVLVVVVVPVVVVAAVVLTRCK